MEQIPNFSERNPNSKPWISFAEFSLIKGLRRPPPHDISSICNSQSPRPEEPRAAGVSKDAPARTTDAAHRTILRDAMLRIPPQDEESGDTRARRRCLFASTFRSFCLRFGSSSFMKQVKGWRHFDRGTLGRHFRPTWRPREPHCAKKGTLHGPKARGLGKRQADRSDVRQEIRPLKRARTGFRAYTSGRAPALHCLRVSHDPCLQAYPFGFADCEADAAAFRRARRERLSSSEKSL